jgi:hypothetical protein
MSTWYNLEKTKGEANMNAQSIIADLTLPRDERQILTKMAEMFDYATPESLYMDYYDLAPPQEGMKRHSDDFPGFPGTTPEQWEKFLDIPEIYRYRTGKIAKLQEFSAIKAMKQLEAQGSIPGASAVTALKELSKLSKQLNTNNQNRQKVILTFVSPKIYTKNA